MNRLLRLIARTADLRARRAQRPRRQIPVFPPDPDQDTLDPQLGMGSPPVVSNQSSIPGRITNVSGEQVVVTASVWVQDFPPEPGDAVAAIGRPTPEVTDLALGLPEGFNITSGEGSEL